MQLPDLCNYLTWFCNAGVYARARSSLVFYLYFGDGIELAVPFFMKFECFFHLIVMVFYPFRMLFIFILYIIIAIFDILNQDAYF